MTTAFQVAELPGRIGLVTFDLSGKKVNTFSEEILAQMAELLDRVSQKTSWIGLLFRSGKAGQFIAGADLKELAALSKGPVENVHRFLEAGHRVLNRWSELPFPAVALIDGATLGGGTEFSLALDQRIATESPTVRIGLPETKLGMIPGWGGTQRLPRLIHPAHALEMICIGEPLSAAQARDFGLVHSVVPAEGLIEGGIRLIGELRENDQWKSRRKALRQPLVVSSREVDAAAGCCTGGGRSATDARAKARLAALQSVREGLAQSLDKGLEIERRYAATVIGSAGATKLIEEFFAGKTKPNGPR